MYRIRERVKRFVIGLQKSYRTNVYRPRRRTGGDSRERARHNDKSAMRRCENTFTAYQSGLGSGGGSFKQHVEGSARRTSPCRGKTSARSIARIDIIHYYQPIAQSHNFDFYPALVSELGSALVSDSSLNLDPSSSFDYVSLELYQRKRD
ncbi:hypothetical protein EVAR_30661_1 [Eumeta japonica]|uniref:Uncharacterized protein n=1 Tax=Eumeta variegata TaxID=151549 RepID=A0A4C1VRA7_EUMVA|nr:hypothetical protein EVAR_30661_1 [Eumeta japonica]